MTVSPTARLRRAFPAEFHPPRRQLLSLSEGLSETEIKDAELFAENKKRCRPGAWVVHRGRVGTILSAEAVALVTKQIRPPEPPVDPKKKVPPAKDAAAAEKLAGPAVVAVPYRGPIPRADGTVQLLWSDDGSRTSWLSSSTLREATRDEADAAEATSAWRVGGAAAGDWVLHAPADRLGRMTSGVSADSKGRRGGENKTRQAAVAVEIAKKEAAAANRRGDPDKAVADLEVVVAAAEADAAEVKRLIELNPVHFDTVQLVWADDATVASGIRLAALRQAPAESGIHRPRH